MRPTDFPACIFHDDALDVCFCNFISQNLNFIKNCEFIFHNSDIITVASLNHNSEVEKSYKLAIVRTGNTFINCMFTVGYILQFLFFINHNSEFIY